MKLRYTMKTNNSLAKSLTWIMGFSFVSAMLPMAFAESSKPLRIMPMGDSITQGVAVPGGYRQPLYDLLELVS